MKACLGTCLPADPINVYRLYNPNNGEHVFTTEYGEYVLVGRAGWHQEALPGHLCDCLVFSCLLAVSGVLALISFYDGV